MQQRRNVVLADHHAAENEEIAAGRPHTRKILTQLSAVERRCAQRPAADRRARQCMVVGMNGRRNECNAASFGEVIEDRRAGGEIGCQPVVIGVLAQYRGKIGLG